MFYPEGGGQPADLGAITTDRTSLMVSDVRKVGGVILHRVKGKLPKVGEMVRGRINGDLRLAHMRHHTGTHIVLAAVREVLGPHVWQAGAQKGSEEARIDITHFTRITDDEKRRIEFLANEIVLKGIPIEKTTLKREDAENKYGLRLYQGGTPAGRNIRVVRIGDFDVQGCGGTHLDNTGEVGMVKIKRTERIQDGVVRIEFSAGLAAVRNIQNMETILETSSQILSVPAHQLPKTVQRFFDEWKSLHKEVKELRKGAVDPDSVLRDAEEIGGVKVVIAKVDLGMDEMMALVREVTQKERCVVIVASGKGGGTGSIGVGRSDGIELDSGAIAREVAGVLGGSGGGKPVMAQGGGPKGEKVDEALERARVLVEKALRA
jgi:alanyl-tRNA synthetase